MALAASGSVNERCDHVDAAGMFLNGDGWWASGGWTILLAWCGVFPVLMCPALLCGRTFFACAVELALAGSLVDLVGGGVGEW